MKKLFFAALFTIGLFSISQAQTCDYYVANADPFDTWDFAVADSGPSSAIYELNILPGQLRTGSISFQFTFPLYWKAQDSNGCYIYEVAPGPTGVITAASTCSGTVAYYQVGTIIPFVQYYLKVELN